MNRAFMSVELLGLMVSVYVISHETSGMAEVSCIPVSNTVSSSCSPTLLALGIVNIFNFSHSNRSVEISHYIWFYSAFP